jgi:hypothetical protein
MGSSSTKGVKAMAEVEAKETKAKHRWDSFIETPCKRLVAERSLDSTKILDLCFAIFWGQSSREVRVFINILGMVTTRSPSKPTQSRRVRTMQAGIATTSPLVVPLSSMEKHPDEQLNEQTLDFMVNQQWERAARAEQEKNGAPPKNKEKKTAFENGTSLSFSPEPLCPK